MNLTGGRFGDLCGMTIDQTLGNFTRTSSALKMTSNQLLLERERERRARRRAATRGYSAGRRDSTSNGRTSCRVFTCTDRLLPQGDIRATHSPANTADDPPAIIRDMLTHLLPTRERERERELSFGPIGCGQTPRRSVGSL